MAIVRRRQLRRRIGPFRRWRVDRRGTRARGIGEGGRVWSLVILTLRLYAVSWGETPGGAFLTGLTPRPGIPDGG